MYGNVNGHQFDMDAGSLSRICLNGSCGQSYVGSSQHPCTETPDAGLDALRQLAEDTVPGFEEAAGWWMATAELDAAHALAKAREYGSADLEIMGKAMESLYTGHKELDPESLRRVGTEMAIAFYNLGKAARMFGAYSRGEVPSDDTWHDATVYPMMARRIRETGQWP